MSSFTSDVDRLLADCQRRWERLNTSERHRALAQVLRAAGSLSMGPTGLVTGGATFAVGHRSHLSAVHSALTASIPLTTRILHRQLGEFDVNQLWPMVTELAIDAGKYIGGGALAGAALGGVPTAGIGALPGAALGAKVGLWVYSAIGITKLIDDLPQMFEQVSRPYVSAFNGAWALGEIGHRDPIRYSLLSHSAARDFATGHALLVVALLAVLATYLARRSVHHAPLFAALANGRLGPKFARWVEVHQVQIAQSPRLKPRKTLAQQVEDEYARQFTRARVTQPRMQVESPTKTGESRALPPRAAESQSVLLSSNELSGVERASDELLDSVGSKRAITYATEGSDALRYLDYRNAEAAALGPDDIILRPNPSKAAVLEEFLHGTQNRLGIVDRLGTSGLGSAETHVKDFMLRHPSMLGLSAEDARRLKLLRDMGL